MAQIDPKDFEKWLKWVDDGLRLSLRDPVKSEILGFGFHQKNFITEAKRKFLPAADIPDDEEPAEEEQDPETELEEVALERMKEKLVCQFHVEHLRPSPCSMTHR